MRDDSFKDFVVSQLSSLDISVRPMFSSFGLYLQSRFFGIISSGRVYFKTNNLTRVKYLECGMRPFAPSKKQVLKNYYEVPVEVVEDINKLKEWAEEAANVG